MNEVNINQLIDQNNELNKEEVFDLHISFNAPVDHQHIDLMIGAIAKRKPKNVYLSICTNGGQAMEVFRFFSCIHENNINLTTYNSSFANSAGLLLFLCGQERICSPYSIFMTHEISMTLTGNFDAIRKNIELNETASQINATFAYERCGVEPKQWDKWHSSSIYGITSNEALHHKVATKIDFLHISEKSKETFSIVGSEFLEKKVGQLPLGNFSNILVADHYLAG